MYGGCSDGVDLLTPKIRGLRGEMRPDLRWINVGSLELPVSTLIRFCVDFGDGFDVVNKTTRDRINGEVRTRFRTSRVHLSSNQDKVISWFTSLPSLLATSLLPLFVCIYGHCYQSFSAGKNGVYMHDITFFFVFAFLSSMHGKTFLASLITPELL